jgi:hypothetical protein
MDIKPIETVYKGYRFRSRLEARWAVFFDALGIEWEYEKEGYDLGEAGWYLPDFWLPNEQVFVEVKPSHIPEEDLQKMPAIGKGMVKVAPLVVVKGVPSASATQFMFIPHSDGVICEVGILDMGDNGLGIHLISDGNGGAVVTWLPFATPCLMPENGVMIDARVRHAVTAARSARFEHGQVGAPHQWK